MHQTRDQLCHLINGRDETRPLCGALLAAALAAFISGCAGSQGPDTVDATGTVTLDGKAVAGANVIFHPLQGDERALASQTVTNEKGRFQLSTHVGAGKYKSGIVPGKYAVAITKLDTAAISSTFAPPRNLLPKKYGNPATSTLMANVATGKDNDFSFNLGAN